MARGMVKQLVVAAMVVSFGGLAMAKESIDGKAEVSKSSQPNRLLEEVCDETVSGIKGAGYRGCQDMTKSKKTCQKWSSQSPQKHGSNTPSEKSKGLGDHNYCRNPDGEHGIWCYTTDEKTRWQYCNPKAAGTTAWTRNNKAALSGYNSAKVYGSVDEVKAACIARATCKSFDYYSPEQWAQLSDSAAGKDGVPPLTTHTSYDYYALSRAQAADTTDSSASTPWSKYLASLAGKTSSAFSWQTACKKLGQTPSGYRSSWGGGKTTFHLTCDSNKIDVVCHGSPFSSCTSPYKPPALASDKPPTGRYAKTANKGSCKTGFSAAERQVFLDIHNKMRCAVGAPPVEWDGALECQAQKTQNSMGTDTMRHASTYGMPIPAGENLATGTSPLNAAWMWFTEYLSSTNYATGGRTGHYSAMVWKSVKKIGCGVGKSGKGIVRCHYAATSKAQAPNMGGQYDNNLSPFYGTEKDFTKCGLTGKEVKGKASLYKGWGILHPTDPMARNIGMYSVTDAIWSNASPTAFFSACAFMGAAAMVTIGVALRRSRSPAASQDDTELLSVEAAEGLE